MNTLIYPDASPAGFPKFNSSLLGAFVVQIRREEKAETEAGSQTPASRPKKIPPPGEARVRRAGQPRRCGKCSASSSPAFCTP